MMCRGEFILALANGHGLALQHINGHGSCRPCRRAPRPHGSRPPPLPATVVAAAAAAATGTEATTAAAAKATAAGGVATAATAAEAAAAALLELTAGGTLRRARGHGRGDRTQGRRRTGQSTCRFSAANEK